MIGIEVTIGRSEDLAQEAVTNMMAVLHGDQEGIKHLLKREKCQDCEHLEACKAAAEKLTTSAKAAFEALEVYVQAHNDMVDATRRSQEEPEAAEDVDKSGKFSLGAMANILSNEAELLNCTLEQAWEGMNEGLTSQFDFLEVKAAIEKLEKAQAPVEA